MIRHNASRGVFLPARHVAQVRILQNPTVVSVMKPMFVCLLLFPLWLSQAARADFDGPSSARRAMSPDGNLVIRITPGKSPDARQTPKHRVTYYEYESSGDRYVRRSEFQLGESLSQMLYVSNAGDLVMIFLDDQDAVRLYSKEGKLVKSWSLGDFLSKAEIDACAQTGSTLQWFEEGAFSGRRFYFSGPSRLVRALQSYTVMRAADAKVSFSGELDVTAVELSKDEQAEP
jgi:hypothetical protein